MCYAISNRNKPEKVEKRFHATFEFENLYESKNVINGFAESLVFIITMENPHLIRPALWGLLPSYHKGTYKEFQKKFNTLNARGETILESRLFAKPAREQRCLIIADGFFEPHKYKKASYPHFIQLKSRESFAFAGIYNDFGSDDLLTCSIITSKANEMMARIHNEKKRMPVVLDPDLENEWISDHLNDDGILSLLKTFTSEQLEAYTISKDFYKWSFDPNTILDRVVYPELSESRSLFD